MIARLLGLLGFLVLAALALSLGVRDILANRRRAGTGRILSGLGLLGWALLGAFMQTRDRFSTFAEWGAFLVGGFLILVGAVLGEQRKHSPQAREPREQTQGKDRTNRTC